MSFLRDLGLIIEDEGVDRLTIAGLLFVGKETAINRLLPQAEVIYLHYSTDNMEEYDSRLDLKQPIISVIERLTEKIQNTNKIVNVQVGLFRLEVEDLQSAEFITNEKIRELCGFTRQQARITLDKMRSEGILRLEGQGRVARYYRN